MASHRWFAPISTLLITALAAIIRIANLANPRLLVFDETYYVKDAYTPWSFRFGKKLAG